MQACTIVRTDTNDAASTVVLRKDMTHDIRFMMTFSIADIMSYRYLSGTIVTVANLGDSRVILGYQKDISPPGSSPRPKIRVTAPDSPGTSHEEISVHSKPQNGEDASARSADSCSLGVDDVEVDTRQWGIITTMPLSTDHKPDDPREAAVIIAAGKPSCHAVSSRQLYLSYLTLSQLTLSYLMLSHLTLSYFISPYLNLSYTTLPYFISPISPLRALDEHATLFLYCTFKSCPFLQRPDKYRTCYALHCSCSY